MDLTKFVIQNPVKVAVGVILTVLFGFLSLRAIPIQLTPDVDAPVITIETRWTGRSPEEIEREVIEEQEEFLKSLDGLKEMKAEAQTGSGTITLEFLIGTDLDDARVRVADKLREVPEYPDGVDEPVIADADADASKAIAWFIFDAADVDLDMQSVFDFAEDRVKPIMESVPGVSRINVLGGRERQVHIRIDPADLATRGVTFNELLDALRFDNVNVSAGDLDDGMREVRVRTVGQFTSLQQIEDTVVRYDASGPVRVRDLGDAVQTLEKTRGFVRSNGQSALAMNAIRKGGSNVMEVMNGLRAAADRVRTEVLPDYEQDRHKLSLRQVYDETVYIRDAIGLVQSNLVIGGVLAAIVLLVFLGKLRPTLIIALAIPVSVLGTFAVMTAAGRNLNVISLAGLAFAVGMVVDNAIVVLENIDRHLHMGKTPARAAYDGAAEVWGAVLASTLTTLAVFLPVLTVQEEAGQLFFDISLAICAAVSLSLLVSITVIPSAAARWLRPVGQASRLSFKPTPEADPEVKRPSLHTASTNHSTQNATAGGVFGRFAAALAGTVASLIRPGAGGILTRVAVVGAFTLAAVGGAAWLMPPTSYLPNGNQNLIFGIMLTPPAYSIEQSRSIAERIEPVLKPYWEAKDTAQATAIGPVYPAPGAEPYPAVPAIKNFFFVRWGPIIFMGASSRDAELVAPLAPLLTGAMANIPGSFGFANQRSIFGRGASGTSSIDVEVIADGLVALRQASTPVYGALAGRYGYGKVQPDPLNFNLAGPEVRFVPDPVRAGDLGIRTRDLGNAVRALVDGLEIGDYRLEGESIDLLLTRHPDVELTPDALPQTPLAVRVRDDATAEGDGMAGGTTMRTVPISAVGTFVPSVAPQQINRIDTRRATTFTVTPPPEVPLEQAVNDVEAMLAGMKADGTLPPGVEARTAGSADKLAQVRRALLGAWTGFNADSLGSVLTSRLFLALLVVYLVMAALFESFLYPLVILFTVPLAAVGGLMGLALVRVFHPQQQLDTLTMLGFVILIGVVVNNAILIVHQAINFTRGIDEGGEAGADRLAPAEAIRASVASRVRPILMTTTTSVCGMLPLVLMGGSGSELYKGLGGVVVGGLLVATVFTLVVVPLTLSFVLRGAENRDPRAAVG